MFIFFSDLVVERGKNSPPVDELFASAVRRPNVELFLSLGFLPLTIAATIPGRPLREEGHLKSRPHPHAVFRILSNFKVIHSSGEINGLIGRESMREKLLRIS